MRRRHVTTGITLLVLVAILVLGAVYGTKALFAPLPGATPSGGPRQGGASASCDPSNVKKGQKLRARQVQVSVFNAGTRGGLADATLRKLRKRGFRRGEVGNLPSDTRVRVVQVWTTQRNDPAARLVAHQFGRKTTVRLVSRSLGPGVDVVVGNRFRRLARARTVIVVEKPGSACLPTSSGSSSPSS